MCAVAVVARRRSEGTHPINKTTRVTIEFNREKNGFQPAKRPGGGRARRDPRSKSPSTYAPLLFIVPNFHSQRTAICRFANGRKRKNAREKRKEREGRKREKNRFREWSHGIRLLRRGERHGFRLFYPGDHSKSTVTFTRLERREGG